MKPVARIFQPAKTAMQSGHAGTKSWQLEFTPAEQSRHDALMGWVSSGDTRTQIRLLFTTREEALAYAIRRGYDYELVEPNPHQIKPKSYADNFRSSKQRDTL